MSTKWISGAAYVNLRKESDNTSTYLDRIPDRFPINVLQENISDHGEVWSRVSFNGKTGYVIQSYITATDSGLTHPTTYREAFGYVNLKNKAGVNLFVKNLQMCLRNSGTYTGSVDGRFGTGTENAVKSWQSNHNLDNDGIVGERTMQALWTSYHVILQSQGVIS